MYKQNADEMTTFFDQWERKEAEPHVLSATEAPFFVGGRQHEEPMLPGVRRVTAKNFKKLVLAKGQNVFFQEFADWCPYCVWM